MTRTVAFSTLTHLIGAIQWFIHRVPIPASYSRPQVGVTIGINTFFIVGYLLNRYKYSPCQPPSFELRNLHTFLDHNYNNNHICTQRFEYEDRAWNMRFFYLVTTTLYSSVLGVAIWGQHPVSKYVPAHFPLLYPLVTQSNSSRPRLHQPYIAVCLTRRPTRLSKVPMPSIKAKRNAPLPFQA